VRQFLFLLIIDLVAVEFHLSEARERSRPREFKERWLSEIAAR
jgi:hypothetical protein